MREFRWLYKDAPAFQGALAEVLDRHLIHVTIHFSGEGVFINIEFVYNLKGDAMSVPFCCH